MEEIYTVNENTIAFIPTIDGFGNVQTDILEVDHLIESHLCPIELVDMNLRFYGSSLKGAHEGTRYILGRVNMCPVIMNLKHHLVWFPTDSPKKNDCVWLSLNHIKSYHENPNKSTQIIFTNNSSLTLEVNFNKFKTRISNAYELKCRLEYSTTHMFIPSKKDFIQFEIIKDHHDKNYQLHMKEEEKDEDSNIN